jgi:hypothetical protein
MKSRSFNRKNAKTPKPLPRVVTPANDPEFAAVIPFMSNVEYKHFNSFAILSYVQQARDNEELSGKYSVFRDNMIRKYGKK